MTVLYVFRCPAAGHDIEEFHHIGLAPMTVICHEHNAEAKRIPARGAFSTVPGGHDAEYGTK